MEQKRVSVKVAKAIRDAGYPQSRYEAFYVERNYNSFKEGILYEACNIEINANIPFVSAPTYVNVWLWLWREKKYRILFSASNQRWDEVHGVVTGTDGEVCQLYHRGVKAYDATDHRANRHDPEAAIISAIDYIVENNLLQ